MPETAVSPAIDFGPGPIANMMTRGGGGQGPVAITQGPAWRTLMRVSAGLIAQGRDGRLALNHLRPCADSPNPAIRVNGTLRKDEWKQMDERVSSTNKETLNAVSDLLGRGLRINIANPFGTTVLESETISDMSEAQVSMYAGTPPQDDRVTYELTGVPVPIISKGFWLDERVLEASRGRGQTLDTANADAATRVVAEKLEGLLFMGGVTYGGYTMYGITNHPNINGGLLTDDWPTLSTGDPSKIVDDVVTMKTQLSSDYAMGPYVLYVPHSWIDSLDNDYFSTVGATPTGPVAATGTIRQRLLQMRDLEDIKPTTQLTNGVVLISMNSNTVEVGFGFEPRLIQWETQGGMVNHFRVISIMTFRIRADMSGQSGIAYRTAA